MSSTPLEAPPDEDLACLLDAIQDLSVLSVPSDPHQAFSRYQTLVRAENLLAAAKLDHLKVVRRIEQQPGPGGYCERASDWLINSLHLPSGAAYAQCCAAAELERFPELDRAVHEGALSPQISGIVLETLRRVEKHLEPRHLDMEFEMLCAAREMEPGELRTHGSKLFHQLDRIAHNNVLDEERKHRFFHLRRQQDGWYRTEGSLDPVAGALLEISLQAIVRADALAEVAEHRLCFPDLPEHGQERPHLTIVATAESLRGDPGSLAPQIDWGTPVSGETAKRLACDAIARIAVVGDRGDGIEDVLHWVAPSAPPPSPKPGSPRNGACGVSWGGAQGAGPAGRRLSLVRAPSQGLPTASLGGLGAGRRTDHENLGEVCPRHHYALHEGGYRTAEVTPQRVVILRPDGSLYLEVPRHRWKRVSVPDGTAT